MTNNVKTSELFLNLESRLDDFLQNIDRIKKDRHSNVTKIEETKTRLVKEIQQKRAEIDKHLDNLEQQIIKDLDEKEYTGKESIQKVLLSVKERETMVTKCQTNFQSIKQYASEIQTFLGMNEMQVKVNENEQFLMSLMKGQNLEQLDLVWKTEPFEQSTLNSLKNFGSIRIKTQTSNIEFTRTKNKQAKLQVETTKKTIDDVKLILQKVITTDGNEITTDENDVRGCCMLKGDVFFTDHFYNKSLIAIASENRIKYKIPLDYSGVFDITLMDEKTVAITSGDLKEEIGIDIIDIQRQRKIKFISLPGRTYGITCEHDSLFVCVEGLGIYKANTLDGTSSLVISCNLPNSSYVSVFSDKIYYTNYKNHSVECCYRNGTRVWTFTEERVLKEPEGITVDNNGHVYIVGEQSSNVVIISKDGKHHKQLLTKDNDLRFPSAIFLDRKNRKLLVANTQKNAFVYNIL